jgi:hypothetical protein
LELQSHHQANPQRKFIAQQTGKAVKDKEAVSLGTGKGTHKANPQRKSIAQQTGKAAKDKEAVTLFCF